MRRPRPNWPRTSWTSAGSARGAAPCCGSTTPTTADDVTAVDIVSDDAPYIVESLWAELERAEYAFDRLLHPQLVVDRDADGVLTHVYDLDDNADVPGRRRGRVLGPHRARPRARRASTPSWPPS